MKAKTHAYFISLIFNNIFCSDFIFLVSLLVSFNLASDQLKWSIIYAFP